MGLKQIFQEGFKDLRRRGKLIQARSSLTAKERAYADRLHDAGKKAWEAKLTVADSQLSGRLQKVQAEWSERSRQAEEREKRSQEKQATRKQENDRFETERKQVEEKKHGIDTELNRGKNLLNQAQLSIERIQNSLKQLDADEIKLKSDSNMIPAEKEKKLSEIKQKRDAGNRELPDRREEAAAAMGQVKPLEDQSQAVQTEIARIRDQQKQTISGLDKEIADLQREKADFSRQASESEKEQRQNYGDLGRFLTAQEVIPETIRSEWEQIQSVLREKEEIQSEISRLTKEGEALMPGALTKMAGLVLAAIIILIIVIWGLNRLTRPKPKQTWPYIPQVSFLPDATTRTPIPGFLEPGLKKPSEVIG